MTALYRTNGTSRARNNEYIATSEGIVKDSMARNAEAQDDCKPLLLVFFRNCALNRQHEVFQASVVGV